MSVENIAGKPVQGVVILDPTTGDPVIKEKHKPRERELSALVSLFGYGLLVGFSLGFVVTTLMGNFRPT